MKVVSSIGSLKNRSKDFKVVRRRGRIYVICKNPDLRFQGGAKDEPSAHDRLLVAPRTTSSFPVSSVPRPTGLGGIVPFVSPIVTL